MTLVELLTALGITVLLLTISLPVFSRQSRVSNIDSSARVVEGVISRTRNFAFNPNREFPASYSLKLVNGSDKTIKAEILGHYYPTADQGDDPIEETIDQISIPNSSVDLSSQTTVDFKAITGQLLDDVGRPDNNGATVKIKSVSTGDTKTISINPLGNIEVSN